MRIYEGIGKNDLIQKKNLFVGYRFFVKEFESITIDSIGLQLTVVNGELPIYVLGSQLNDIMMIVVKHDFALNMIWKEINIKLEKNKYYYIGYYDNDLKGNAIARIKRINDCRQCDKDDWEYYQQWKGKIDIRPFQMLNKKVEFADMINFGMNLQWTV